MKVGDSVAEPMSIGEKIRFYREKLGLTQEDVANRLHTKPQNIYKYEKGIIENIPLANIVAMAELFDITPAELAGWGNPFRSNKETPFDRDMAARRNRITLTELEKELLLRYRKNPELHEKLHELLNINADEFDSTEPIVYERYSAEDQKRAKPMRAASPGGSRYGFGRFGSDDD